MENKKFNGRCPLQVECERKCTYEYHEQDCDYYQGNSRSGYEIAELVKHQEDVVDMEEHEEPEGRDLAPIKEKGEAFWTEKGKLVNIRIDDLHPHPNNPRKDLGDLSELAESIKVNGILQNLTVVPMISAASGEGYCPSCALYLPSSPTMCRDDHKDRAPCKHWQDAGRYTVVIGHRRLAAAKLAGVKELPCMVSDMDRAEQLRTMLMENIQREDLTVYEQAHGFQMMLDLGDTLESVSQKTGFSEATIRRRTKLLDLDQKKFKEAESRGATLFDYMELDKIKSADRKNEVLGAIGTDNFKYMLKQAIDVEAREECMEKWVAAMSAFATKVDDNKGYRQVDFYYATGEPNVKRPENADSVEYFFYADKYGSIRLLVRESNVPKPAEDPEVVKRRERIEQRRTLLREAAERAYELRREFAQNVTTTTIKKHLADIVSASLWSKYSYFSNEMDDDEILEMLGLSDDDGEDDGDGGPTFEAFSAPIAKAPERMLWEMVYRELCDDSGEGYYEPYNAAHTRNERLDVIYGLLEKLGYRLSDEEKALRDGTHELFQEEAHDGQ